MDDIYIDEDELFRINFSAQDQNGDELSWDIGSNAEWLKGSPLENRLIGTPGNNDVGKWWVNISVFDGHGGSDYSNFTINVQNVNDPPIIATMDIITAIEDTYYQNQYLATDVDPTFDELTWNLETNATFLSIDRGTGLLFGRPVQEDIGRYRVNISVSDGRNGTDFHDFILIVLGTNDGPKIGSQPSELVMDEDTVIRGIDLEEWFYDPDGDELRFDYDAGDNISILMFENNTLEIQPLPDWSGSELVIFTASDLMESVSITLKVNVGPVNDPPTNALITFEDMDYLEDAYQPATANVFDPDLPYGDVLNYSWHSNISGSIGWGKEIDMSLPSGHHYITLTVTDSEDSRTSVSAFLRVYPSRDNTPDDDIVAEDDDAGFDDGDEKNNSPLILTIIAGLLLLIILVSVVVVISRRSGAAGDLEEE